MSSSGHGPRVQRRRRLQVAVVGFTAVAAAMPLEISGQSDVSDVAIVVTAPDPVDAGDTVVFSLRVTNGGPADATGVAVTDSFPSELQFLSASDGGVATGGRISWPLIELLPVGSYRDLSLTAFVSGRNEGRVSVVNTAFVTTTSVDPAPGNNASTASFVIEGVSGQPDLEVMVSGPDSVGGEDLITYHIDLWNNGMKYQEDVVLRDELPEGGTFVDAVPAAAVSQDRRILTWPSIPDFRAGEHRRFTVRYRAPPSPDTITNIAFVVSAAFPDGNPADNTSRVVTQVLDGQPDLRVVKSGPDSVGGGDTITYRIELSNRGTRYQEDVVLRDELPQRGTFIDADPLPAVSADRRVLTWPSIDELAVDSLRRYTVRYIAPPSPDTITNIAFVVSAAFEDANPLDDTSRVVTRVLDPPQPLTNNVTITKSGPATVDSGAVITYTLTVKSHGPLSATNVHTSDTLPVRGRFIRATPQPSSVGNGVVTWPILSSLNPDSTVTYVVLFEAPGGPDKLVNTGTVKWRAVDGSTRSAVSRVHTTVTTAGVDLAVDKWGPEEALAGDTVRYFIDVVNRGSVPATNVLVDDALPDGADVVDLHGGTQSGRSVRWTVPLLLPDSARSFMLDLSYAQPGTYTNRVTVAADEPDTDLTNNVDSATTVVTRSDVADLKVTKTPDILSKTAAPASFSYTLVVSNQGPSTARGVVLIDTLPEAALFDSASVQSTGGALDGRIITWQLGDLLPAESATREIEVTFVTKGEFLNSANTFSETPDPNPTDNYATARVFVNVPPNVLRASKAASRTQVYLGETVRYTVKVYWAGTDALSGEATLRDRLPTGFAYQTGSARLNGVGANDPTRNGEGALVFPLGAIGIADTAVVEYSVEITRSPPGGYGINRAQAFVETVTSEEVSARVRVLRDAPEGMIVGTVRSDCGCEALGDSDPREIGIPGVRVLLQDGRAALTDTEGKFSFVGLSPRTWIVRVDPMTLPVGSHMVPLTNRHAGRGTSVFVDLKSGELHRAEFQEASHLRTVRADVQNRRSTMVIAEIYRGPGYDVPSGRPALGPYRTLTPTARRLDWEGALRQSHEPALADSVPPEPVDSVDARGELPPLIAIGLLEARLDLRSLASGEFGGGAARDRFEDALRTFSASSDDEQQQVGARASLFVDGAVGDGNRLTLRLDSEQDRRGRFFNDIRPDESYPVLGDASLHGFNAQSKGRLFGRLARGASYAQWGDFNTASGVYGAAGARSLGEYSRTLNGWLQHYESAAVSIDAFASRDRALQVIDEIPGRGVSGPYALTRPAGLINSETVEIITRDRNQPAVVLSSERLQRFADYSIEPFSGRIIFKRPIPPTDESFNPVSIRVQYEVETGGDTYWVGGANAKALLGDRLEVGGGIVRDDNPLARFDLASFNATFALGASTTFTSEYARTDSASTGAGDASRFELRHSSDRFNSRLFFLQTDQRFANPSSPFRRGRREFGLLGSVSLRPGTSLFGEALRTQDRRTGDRVSGGRLAFDHRLTEWITGQLGFRYADTERESSNGDPQLNEVRAVGARVSAKLPGAPQGSLFAEFEQDVVEGDRRRASVGADYRLLDRTRLYGRHEFIGSLLGPYDPGTLDNRNSTVFGIATDYGTGQSAFSEYRAKDAFSGREAQAAIGLRNRWEVRDGVRLSASAERLSPLTEGGETGSAVTGALALTHNPLWKASARAEYYAEGETERLFGSAGFARKINRDFTLLARSVFSTELDGGRAFERSQLGIAYRETERNRWNLLGRYEHRYDREAGASGESSSLISSHVNVAVTPELQLRGQWATQFFGEPSIAQEIGAPTTHMGGLRATLDVADGWDVGLIGRALLAGSESARQLGLGAEVGVVLTRDLRLAAGYNVFGFRNPDLSADDYTDHGFYLQLGFKFDESLFGFDDPDPVPPVVTGCGCLVGVDSADVAVGIAESSGRTVTGDSVDVPLRITAPNLGPDSATAVRVAVSLGPEARVADAGRGIAVTAGRVEWDAEPVLSAGGTLTRALSLRMATCDTVQITATVTAATVDPNRANNTATDSISTRCPAAPRPDIGVSIGAMRVGPRTAGDSIEFIVETQASTDTPAFDVAVTGSLTGDYVAARVSRVGPVAGTFAWPPEDFAPGRIRTDTVTVPTAACPRSGERTVTLNVRSSARDDRNASNDSDSLAVVLLCAEPPKIRRPPAPSLQIDGPTLDWVDSTLKYVVVTTTEAAADSLTITISLPGSTYFVGGWADRGGPLRRLSGTILWPTRFDLARGDRLIDTLRIRARGDPRTFTLAPVARAYSGGFPGPPAGGQATTTVDTVPRPIPRVDTLSDLRAWVAGPRVVRPGDTVVYEIRTRNRHSDTAHAVGVTALRDPRISFIEASSETIARWGVDENEVGGLAHSTWPLLPELPPGEVVGDLLRLVFPESPDSFQVGAEAFASGRELTPDDNYYNFYVRVDTIPWPDLVLELDTISTDSTEVLFQLSTINWGNVTADAVRVTATMPPGARFVSASGGGGEQGGVISWPLVDSLTYGEPGFVETFRVAFPPASPLLMRAVAVTPTPELITTNNGDSTVVLQDTIFLGGTCDVCPVSPETPLPWWVWLLFVVVAVLVGIILWMTVTNVIERIVYEYRDTKQWTKVRGMTRFIPFWISRRPRMRRVQAFTLNREGKRTEAESILKELIAEEGWNSWNAGHLGRVYKDQFDDARCRDQTGPKTRELLDRAIETYRKGHSPGEPDPYPGLNALTLSEFLPDAPAWKALLQDEVKDALRKLVDAAKDKMVDKVIGKVLGGAKPAEPAKDYWTSASLMEMAVLSREQEVAESALTSALEAPHKVPQVETTLRNQYLIKTAREAKSELIPEWVLGIIAKLEEEIERQAST